jgi:hypothetical protein
METKQIAKLQCPFCPKALPTVEYMAHVTQCRVEWGKAQSARQPAPRGRPSALSRPRADAPAAVSAPSATVPTAGAASALPSVQAAHAPAQADRTFTGNEEPGHGSSYASVFRLQRAVKPAGTVAPTSGPLAPPRGPVVLPDAYDDDDDEFSEGLTAHGSNTAADKLTREPVRVAARSAAAPTSQPTGSAQAATPVFSPLAAQGTRRAVPASALSISAPADAGAPVRRTVGPPPQPAPSATRAEAKLAPMLFQPSNPSAPVAFCTACGCRFTTTDAFCADCGATRRTFKQLGY